MLKSSFQRSALPPCAANVACAVVPNGVDGELVARVRAEAAAEAEAEAAAEAAAAPAAGPRLVYTSSYDRGLEHMLRHGWPLVRKAVPTATLHLYYGWETHELLHPASAWRDGMKELIASLAPSVIDHGRVGQPELLAAKARSHLHYYVGDWPEIDCIAVRESAMLGCVPLTSRTAVFGDKEKDYCVRVPGDPTLPSVQRAAAAEAIRLLAHFGANGAMPQVVSEALREETWDRIAARWLQVVGRDRAL